MLVRGFQSPVLEAARSYSVGSKAAGLPGEGGTGASEDAPVSFWRTGCLRCCTPPLCRIAVAVCIAAARLASGFSSKADRRADTPCSKSLMRQRIQWAVHD